MKIGMNDDRVSLSGRAVRDHEEQRARAGSRESRLQHVWAASSACAAVSFDVTGYASRNACISGRLCVTSTARSCTRRRGRGRGGEDRRMRPESSANVSGELSRDEPLRLGIGRALRRRAIRAERHQRPPWCRATAPFDAMGRYTLSRSTGAEGQRHESRPTNTISSSCTCGTSCRRRGRTVTSRRERRVLTDARHDPRRAIGEGSRDVCRAARVRAVGRRPRQRRAICRKRSRTTRSCPIPTRLARQLGDIDPAALSRRTRCSSRPRCRSRFCRRCSTATPASRRTAGTSTARSAPSRARRIACAPTCPRRCSLSAPESYDGGELVIQDTLGERSVKLAERRPVPVSASSVHRVTPVTRGVRARGVLLDAEHGARRDAALDAVRARLGDSAPRDGSSRARRRSSISPASITTCCAPRPTRSSTAGFRNRRTKRSVRPTTAASKTLTE